MASRVQCAPCSLTSISDSPSVGGLPSVKEGVDYRRLTAGEISFLNDNGFKNAKYQYVVLKDIKALLNFPSFSEAKWVTVKEGFLSDGCSFGLCVDGLWPQQWIFHDWLYATHCTDDNTHININDADSVLAPHREFVIMTVGHERAKKDFQASNKRGVQFFWWNTKEVDTIKFPDNSKGPRWIVQCFSNLRFCCSSTNFK